MTQTTLGPGSAPPFYDYQFPEERIDAKLELLKRVNCHVLIPAEKF
jgi:hypothetical protein